MGLFEKKKEKNTMYVYSEKDQETVEEMVSRSMGEYESVFHELVSPDLHIDVIPIPPAEGRDYLTLVTLGMGAYKMPVPERYGKMNRAELAMRLPADWDIQSNEEKWYWPIRVLKALARLPYHEEGWLGLYHDVNFGGPFSEETELCGILLDFFDESTEPAVLENGDEVLIYNVIPLYRSEMEYLKEKGAEVLTEKLGDAVLHGALDVHREKAI